MPWIKNLVGFNLLYFVFIAVCIAVMGYWLSLSLLGEIFSGLIGPALKFLIKKNVAPGLAVMIGVFGFLILLYLLIRWLYIGRTVIKPLKKAIVGITNEKKLAGQFETIDQDLLKSNETVAHVWKEFKETLIKSQTGEDDEASIYQNTVNPAEYFYPAAFGAELNFFRIWPNVFVGIGLVITFAGIISALTAALGGIASDTATINESQEALRTLLNATSAKFYASMVGLFFSIVIAISIRWYSRWVRGAFNSICLALEKGLRSISPEDLAAKQLKELRNQTRQLETFGTDLAMQVGKEVREAIGGGAQQVVENVAGESFTAMATELSEVVKALGTLPQNISKGGEKFEEKMQDFLNNFTKTLDDMKERLDKNSEERDRAYAKQMSNFSEGMTKVVDERIGSIGQAIGELNGPIDRLKENLESSAKEIGDATQQTREVTEELNQALTKMSSILEVTREAAFNAAKGVENIKDPLEEVVEFWKTHHSRIEETDKKLGDYLKQINDNTAKVTTKLNDFVAKLDNKFGSSISSLETVIEDLQETLEKKQKKDKRIKK